MVDRKDNATVAERKAFGLAAMDESGVLSPFTFTRSVRVLCKYNKALQPPEKLAPDQPLDWKGLQENQTGVGG